MVRVFNLRDQLLIRRARRSARRGDFRRAISILTEVNRRSPSPEIEIELVRLRHDGFYAQTKVVSHHKWPPVYRAAFPEINGIPEIKRSEVSPELLRAGVFDRGSIIIRGVLDADQVALIRDGIERTYANHDRAMAGIPLSETAPWFWPFEPNAKNAGAELDRNWYRDGGAELAADSPRGLFNLLEVLEANGLIDLVAGYLGERPALSVRKTSLRRIPHDLNAEHGWHQDGAFLGQGIRTMNLWIALSDCGIDAPSMDMVPRRLNYIVPTGTEGAIFDWSVSSLQIAEACGGGEPTHLHFKAGDAIVFDEMNLHRTSTLPGMTKPRYAIEAWFFAPSCYPLDQLPLLV